MKFESEYKLKIDGFWDAESTLKGILVDYARNSEFPFYVLEIVEDQEETGIRVQDEKGGASGATQETIHGVAKGQRIGVSNYTAMKGLEKYIGHHVEMTFTGMKELTRGREQREFDIEVSDKRIRLPEARSARNGGRFAPRA